MSVKDIVDVVIRTKSGAVGVQSFGIFTIVGSSQEDAFRTRRYSTLGEMTADGFVDTDPEYVMAEGLLSAELPPAEFIVGQTATTDANITETIEAVRDSEGGFYGFAWVGRVLADQQSLADWAELQDYALFLVCDDSVDNINGVHTGTIAKYCYDNALERTAVLYHEDADTDYPEGGFAGAFLTREVGSYTVKFKDMKGFVPSVLTTAQQGSATSVKANVFMDKGGNGTFRMLLEGTSASKFIDEVVSEDWVKARISESILSMFKANDIVPYDEVGQSMVENTIRGVLDLAISKGIITEHNFDEDGERTGGYVIESDPMADIPSAVKETRDYDNYTTFTYYKRVAMHSIKVTGYALY